MTNDGEMRPDSKIVELRHDEGASRYEARLADGSVAVIDYRVEQGRALFTHTGTPEPHRGQGIAGRLTRFALDDVVERGLKIVPYCPFTAYYIRENPGYREHVAGR